MLFRKVLPPHSGGETLRSHNDLPTRVPAAAGLRRISTRRNDEQVAQMVSTFALDLPPPSC